MSTREHLDLASVVGESIEIPCEISRHEGNEPAGWVLWTIQCCGERKHMGFICRACLDHYLTTENAVRCNFCDYLSSPARAWITRYEPINLPAI